MYRSAHNLLYCVYKTHQTLISVICPKADETLYTACLIYLYLLELLSLSLKSAAFKRQSRRALSIRQIRQSWQTARFIRRRKNPIIVSRILFCRWFWTIHQKDGKKEHN